ncbi:DUF1822 family protein [Sphaerospermopsis aphanizomenoides BCCUSP55]|uniref:DUF1822 family protein n=1 Tax=Sphaerospermopsis aphanizomenoides TaxID=459663 RepID=UPI001906E32F|nr:DUF1822 family protein [Sphaerospermopsis aphanizomenoides]MBK1987658.1 DUF1822 family protein [Sphaerospermopsis aphanizomenoides BCCUSP55]
MTYVFADPRAWELEISPTLQEQSWQHSQVYTTPSSRWCAYINQICLDVFLNWIQAEYVPNATAWECIPEVPGFWEFVNGTVVLLGQKRVALIPSEAIDDGELEAPQEWVDIPNWAADYYIAVQVKPDDNWVRFWGYTTHQELKSLANYDPVDRTYCIDAQDLTKDLNAFWMTYQFSTEEMKAAIAPLGELSATQAENLCQRLGNSSVAFPRLAVPFTTWGALLDNQQWRQHLYQQRQQLQFSTEQKQQLQSSTKQIQQLQSSTEQRQQLQSSTEKVNLSSWLEGIYESSWKTIETFLGTNAQSLAFSFRSSSGLTGASVKRAKLIDLGMQLESQQLVLLIALTPEANQEISIRVQLHPASGETYLPPNIKLALLTESAEIIHQVQSREQDNYIQLPRFDGEVGECFSIQVAVDDCQITENFMV